MSKILVTGADGFIGSHLVEHLVRLGHDVRAFVLYNSFNSWGWLDSCAPDVVGSSKSSRVTSVIPMEFEPPCRIAMWFCTSPHS